MPSVPSRFGVVTLGTCACSELRGPLSRDSSSAAAGGSGPSVSSSASATDVEIAYPVSVRNSAPSAASSSASQAVPTPGMTRPPDSASGVAVICVVATDGLRRGRKVTPAASWMRVVAAAAWASQMSGLGRQKISMATGSCPVGRKGCWPSRRPCHHGRVRRTTAGAQKLFLTD
jgi:hypothetical protein